MLSLETESSPLINEPINESLNKPVNEPVSTFKLASNEEINALHEKIKLPAEYFKKHERMPACPIQRMSHNWNRYDHPRCLCILDFKEWIEKHNISINRLAYTYDDFELELLTGRFEPKEKVFLPYPPFDLHTFSEEFLQREKKVDFFLFNQTLEHVQSPFQVVKSISQVVEKDGYVFTSVPTINIPHMTPFHFQGIYPIQLALLFVQNGFEVVEMGQFGSLKYIEKMFQMYGWPDWRVINTNGRIINEDKHVAQCWILARKL